MICSKQHGHFPKALVIDYKFFCASPVLLTLVYDSMDKNFLLMRRILPKSQMYMYARNLARFKHLHGCLDKATLVEQMKNRPRSPTKIFIFDETLF